MCVTRSRPFPPSQNGFVQISMVMDKFEAQFTDLDVQTSYMEDTMGATTAISTPQDQIDQLLRQTAEEANIEMQHDLTSKELNVNSEIASPALKDEDDKLAERLRALRPAT
jgi:charged multivesicular body protein 1